MRPLSLAPLAWLLAAVPSPVLAHAAPPTPQDVWSRWTADPVVLVPLALAALLYARGLHRLWRRAGLGRGIGIGQAASFAGGLAVLLVALVSPLDALAEALFSAHMAQHVALMAVAAPLLALGAPVPALLQGLPRSGRVRLVRWTNRGPWRAAGRRLGHPVVAALLQVAVLWAWHAPALFQAALRSEAGHAAMHASLLAAALLFWWSVVPVGRRKRSDLLTAVVAVLITLKLSGLLGAIVGFATHPLYPAYGRLSEPWGLSPLADQQIAGPVMWAVAGPVYVVTGLVFIAAWLRALEGRHARPDPLISTG